ncbi:hypothetical protein AB0D83_01710 [Streptomyces decoyicus]|uniref:hypothetical protein n=1 Tax=Streptomyces decoyicus TaxID=249567 RepID=UPI0033D3FAF9
MSPSVIIARRVGGLPLPGPTPLLTIAGQRPPGGRVAAAGELRRRALRTWEYSSFNHA